MCRSLAYQLELIVNFIIEFYNLFQLAMYNGIGLQTARGSGTSGYIQKNLSYNVKKMETKQEFLKRLEDARKNNTPTARKANPEIIEHERKREIYIQKTRLRAKLEEEGLPEDQIEQRLEKAEKIIRQKLEKGELQTKNKDTHVMTEAKQRQYKKLTEAFGIKQDKHGSAFDFEAQNQSRLRALQQKRQRMNFTCPHENCQKSYDSQQRLDRHLKYKHPKQLEGEKEPKQEGQQKQK